MKAVSDAAKGLCVICSEQLGELHSQPTRSRRRRRTVSQAYLRLIAAFSHEDSSTCEGTDFAEPARLEREEFRNGCLLEEGSMR